MKSNQPIFCIHLSVAYIFKNIWFSIRYQIKSSAFNNTIIDRLGRLVTVWGDTKQWHILRILKSGFMCVTALTLWENVFYTPIWGIYGYIYGSNFCDSTGPKLTWNVPVTAPNEIRPYFGQTCIWIPSGIVEVPNHGLGGHFPKSAFALWQVRNNNCIFFLNNHWLT